MLDIVGTIGPAKLRAWARELLDAQVFYDKHNYVHPAVHAGNVMLFMTQRRGVTVKLSDGYGAQLRDLGASQPRSVTNRGDWACTLWAAPELTYTEPLRISKTCIWELGVIVMQMALGRSVKSNFTSPMDAIEEVDFETSFEQLLEEMFRSNETRRPAAFQLRNKKFFFEENDNLFQKRSRGLPITPGRERRDSEKHDDSRYRKDWEEATVLGRGGFGKVVRARNKLDSQFYAIKILKNDSLKKLEDILREVALLAKLNHPSIVRYYNAWYETEQDEPTEAVHQRPFHRSIAHTAPASVGHDFMEPSVYGNQGAEFSSSGSGGMFAYQAPPSIDDENGYDDDPFMSDPEPNRGLEEEDTDPFERSNAQQPEFNNDDNPFVSGDSPVKSLSYIPDKSLLLMRNERSKLYIQMELCEGQTLRTRIERGLPKDLEAVSIPFSKRLYC